MTKPGDLQTKKTIHELSKEFPEASYRNLEIYRDADRQEEAQQIITQQENEELKADQGTKIWDEVWKARYEKEYKLRQEAIELFNACHAKAIELEEELKKLRKTINPVQKARESGL